MEIATYPLYPADDLDRNYSGRNNPFVTPCCGKHFCPTQIMAVTVQIRKPIAGFQITVLAGFCPVRSMTVVNLTPPLVVVWGFVIKGKTPDFPAISKLMIESFDPIWNLNAYSPQFLDIFCQRLTASAVTFPIQVVFPYRAAMNGRTIPPPF